MFAPLFVVSRVEPHPIIVLLFLSQQYMALPSRLITRCVNSVMLPPCGSPLMTVLSGLLTHADVTFSLWDYGPGKYISAWDSVGSLPVHALLCLCAYVCVCVCVPVCAFTRDTLPIPYFSSAHALILLLSFAPCAFMTLP